MFNIKGWEIVIIILAFLLIFGPSQVPRLARGLGDAIRELRGIGKTITEDDEVK